MTFLKRLYGISLLKNVTKGGTHSWRILLYNGEEKFGGTYSCERLKVWVTQYSTRGKLQLGDLSHNRDRLTVGDSHSMMRGHNLQVRGTCFMIGGPSVDKTCYTTKGSHNWGKPATGLKVEEKRVPRLLLKRPHTQLKGSHSWGICFITAWHLQLKRPTAKPRELQVRGDPLHN